jgi:hypothetical protein
VHHCLVRKLFPESTQLSHVTSMPYVEQKKVRCQVVSLQDYCTGTSAVTMNCPYSLQRNEQTATHMNLFKQKMKKILFTLPLTILL